jgi:hypothetical protein
VRQVDEMLVLLPQFLNDDLVSLQLSGHMLHGVQDEHTFRDVVILVGGEPVWEDGIGSSLIRMGEFMNLYSS